MPPERLDEASVVDKDGKIIRPRYDIRSDIWSLGITLAEVFKGQLPYECEIERKEDSLELAKIIKKTTSEEILESIFKDREEHKEFRDFLQACLNKFELRPKYDVLMEMEFYKNYFGISETTVRKLIIFYKLKLFRYH